MATDRALFKQIVATYADALYEVAAGEGTVDQTGAQLGEVVRIVRGHSELRVVVMDAAYPAATRSVLVREVFAGYSPAILAIIDLMLERGEIDALSALVEAYSRVSEEKRNVAVVDVTTAVELDDALRAAISSKLSADIGKEVVLRERVDAGIVGGIIIDAMGRRIDASITSQLERARMALSTAHTGGDA
jgi:F-type H+-transporting ATPase subunit delta